MLPLITILFSSFVIGLSGAMMPGPLLTVTISESSRRGFIAGPIIILGHGVLELLLVLALLLGMAPLLKNPLVFSGISIVGSGILLWMAIDMFRSLKTLTLDFTKKESDKKKGNLSLSGALLSLANPYWSVWWATVGIAYIINAWEFGFTGVILFFIGHIGADLVWFSVIALTVAKGREFISDKSYRRVIAFCAIILLLFAAVFLFYGLRKLF